MTNLTIHGGKKLNGRITPSANKNAVLPVLCATLLTDQPITLANVPDITDVRKILAFFRELGSKVEADFSTGQVRLAHGPDLLPQAPALPQGLRSAIMLIPPLLHRFGAAFVQDDSKGCTLGVREIDPHIEIFRAFGAEVEIEPEGVRITAKRLRGASHWLDYASVTSTENFLMCAAIATGDSRLVNAACEPHVQEFCAFLQAAGLELRGAGTSTVHVAGKARLAGAEFTFARDFHEVVTFLALGAITGGRVEVRNDAPAQFQLLDRTFAKFGVEISHAGGWSSARVPEALKVKPPFTQHLIQKVEAAPWPYIPADLLPIFIALGCVAEGSALYWNKVYEGALGWTSELGKFGVRAIACDPHRVIVTGGLPLSPARVESPYIIRVAIALLMVAASVEGRSVILNADPIRRAHPDFVENLLALGADVEWTS